MFTKYYLQNVTLDLLERIAVTHVIVLIRQTVTISTDIVKPRNVIQGGKVHLAKPVCTCVVLRFSIY